MKIKQPNKIKDLIIRKLLGLVWRIENTGDGNFHRNGELSFIQSIGQYYSGKPFILFDIGANRGEYTELVLQHSHSPRLEAHLFEPQKTCCKIIAEKLSDDTRVVVNNTGLSSTVTEARLFKDQESSVLASLYQRNIKHYNLELNESETVTLIPALNYIKEKNIEHINLIKLDVEGHELDALAGFGDFLKPENVDFIQFEYGGANLDSHTSLLDLFTFFESKGFVLCKVMKKSLEIQQYKPRFENFMCQNWVAANPEFIS